MPKDTSTPSEKAPSSSAAQNIPRPPNAWILYRNAVSSLPGFKEAYPNIAARNASNIIARLWRAEPPEVRSYWAELAHVKAEEHARTYPEYKYQPRRRNENEPANKKRNKTKMRQQPSEVSQIKDPSQFLPSSFVANPGSGRSHTGPPETSWIVNEDQPESYMSNSSAERDHHDLSSNEGNHSLNFIATESGNPKLVLDPFAAISCLQSKEWPSLSDILNVDEMLGNLDPNQAHIEYWAGLNISSGSQLNSTELMTVDCDVDPFDNTNIDSPDNFNLNVSLGYIDPSIGISALPSNTVSATAHSQSISPSQSFGAFSGSAPSSYAEKSSASYPIPSTLSYPASSESESASKQRLHQEAALNLDLNDLSLIGSYDLHNHTSSSSQPTNLQTYIQPQPNFQTKVYGWNPQAQTHLIHPYPPSNSQYPLHQSYSALRSDSISKTGDVVGPVISAYSANPIAPQHQPLQTAFWANQTPQPPSAHFDMMMTDGGNGSALYAPDELVVASC